MNISGQEFIQAMSAIGAGIAMIAGVGPGTPGTVSKNNWTYRLAGFSQYQSVIKDIEKKVKKAKR